MAPGRALEKLFEQAPDAYDVTIFNAEPRVNYDRIMLSPVLSGEKTFEQIVIHGDGWYVKHGVTLYKGATVTQIDRDAKTVTSARGVTVPYDKLLIATGSLPIIIPVPGHKLAGVLSYRDLDDVQAMLIAAKSRGKAVVIGGGLLGLEAAVGLKEQGMDVTVVHLAPTLMERQLDTPAGHLLQRAIEQRGIKVLTKANTKAILGEKKVEAVLLEDGTRLVADLVVMAVGIKPNAQLAKDAGIDGQSRHRRRCAHAHQRPRHLRRRRMRRSARPGVRPRRAALRDGGRHRGAARRRPQTPRSRRARSRPSSRSPASTCSRPATSPRARTARRSCCATRRAASTSGSCSRTTS